MEGYDATIDEDNLVEELVDPELIKEERLRKLRAKIGRSSKAKGSRYEHELGNKIASYFGFKGTDVFIFAKNNAEKGQVHGDLIPVKQMARYWMDAGLGVLEAKNREEWSFNQFFTGNLKNNKIYQYWLKSNADTNTDNSLIFFTKNHVTDLVFHRIGHAKHGNDFLTLTIGDCTFIIQSLKSFLLSNFPQI